MNIFETLVDKIEIFMDIICCGGCIGCYEQEEIIYNGDYIANYIIELSREIECNEKYHIH